MTMTALKMTGIAILAGTVVTFAACSKQESATQMPAGTMANMPAQTTAGAPASTGAAEITFTSNPETPKMGDNTFDVMVMQDGKPVDDAQVSVELYMAAMPQMKMPEMRNKAELKPMGKGMYQGTAQVMTAGNWDVTVMAMKNGQEIGTKKLTVTAQ
jgi:uncharacterized GH25 family protein